MLMFCFCSAIVFFLAAMSHFQTSSLRTTKKLFFLIIMDSLYFDGSPTNVQLTICNFISTCQLILLILILHIPYPITVMRVFISIYRVYL